MFTKSLNCDNNRASVAIKIMKIKQKLFYAVGGFFIGNAILLGLILGFKVFDSKEQISQIELNTATQKIENQQIREITFKNNPYVIFEDVSGNKFEVITDGEPTRESLLNSVKEYNKLHSTQMIKLNMEPARIGWGWLVLINFVPFALIGIGLIFFIAAFFITGKKEKLE